MNQPQATPKHERSQDYPRFRAMHVKYRNTTGNGKVVITDLYESLRHRETGTRDTKKRVSLSYDYKVGNVLEQGLTYLKVKGWNPVSFCEVLDGWIVQCDSWGEDYNTL